MRKQIVFLLALVSFAANAQTTTAPDPLKQILDKLNSIEGRLDKLEGQPSQANTATSTAPKQAPSKNVTTPSQNPAKDELISGMIIKIKRGQPKDGYDKEWINNLPNDSFAGFVTNSATITTPKIQENAIGYKGAFGITAQGFLNVEKAGLYGFGILHQIIDGSKDNSAQCRSYISINGSKITDHTQRLEKKDSRSIDTNMLISGSVSLEPGIYEYESLSACTDHFKDRYGRNSAISRTFLIKTPDDLSLRNIGDNDIFYKK